MNGCVDFGLKVVLGEEIDHVRLITLNRPKQLNAISPELVTPFNSSLKILLHGPILLLLFYLFFYFILGCYQVSLLAAYLEKWEKDDEAYLIIIKVVVYFINL